MVIMMFHRHHHHHHHHHHDVDAKVCFYFEGQSLYTSQLQSHFIHEGREAVVEGPKSNTVLPEQLATTLIPKAPNSLPLGPCTLRDSEYRVFGPTPRTCAGPLLVLSGFLGAGAPRFEYQVFAPPLRHRRP